MMKSGSAKNHPLVSVFMPVYNQERYVAAALDSALNQTYKNYEIVISDDCSKDLTPIIVSDYAQRFPDKISFHKLSTENLGDGHFPLLLEKCKGEYICMFAGDDIMYPEKIARQMNDVQQFGLSFHSHSVDCIDDAGLIFGDIKVSRNRVFKGNGYCILNGVPTAGCSWLVKKSHTTFTPSLSFLHDFDMVIRVLMDGRVGYVCNEKLGAYRVTPKSWSRNLNFRNYMTAYINLCSAWLASRMYSECLWLILRVLVRLPSKLISLFKLQIKN